MRETEWCSAKICIHEIRRPGFQMGLPLISFLTTEKSLQMLGSNYFELQLVHNKMVKYS